MIILKKSTGARDEKGTWFKTVTTGGKEIVAINCPGCGVTASLTGHAPYQDWNIAADGSVSPSVDHSNDSAHPCSFHDHIKLEGWVG